jgi:hypothetical protein
MLRYNINTGVRKIKTKTAIIGSTIVLGLGGATFGLALPFAANAAGNPRVDTDCSTEVTDPTTGEHDTRANLYGCKPIGNSGDEQGIYTLSGSAAKLGYDNFDSDVTCTVLVKWSGNYENNPYLNYGTVFNNTKCSNGYVEIWGDNFNDDPVPNQDPYASTPYVDSVGGSYSAVDHGSLIHPN